VTLGLCPGGADVGPSVLAAARAQLAEGILGGEQARRELEEAATGLQRGAQWWRHQGGWRRGGASST
jgi:hypothetical protein